MIVNDVFDDCKKLIGKCSDQEVFDHITDAIEVLDNKSTWNASVGLVDICAMSDCKSLTLPREVETPLAVNVGGQPRYFRNRWHEFHLNGEGSMKNTPWTWDDSGDFCTFMDIIQSSNLVALADLKTDLSKHIRVYGYDDTGKWIRTQEAGGTWLDGFSYPLNVLTDFPGGIVIPDTQRLDVRNFSMPSITTLDAVSGAHELLSGAQVSLSLVTPPMPTPLDVSTAYFINSKDSDTISLHLSRSASLSSTAAVEITSAQPTSVIKLRNERIATVLTQFRTSIAHNIQTGTLVSFTATTMPFPLLAGVDYFARAIDATNFTVHQSLAEAQQNINPIDVSTPGSAVVAKAKQYLAPRTVVNFTVNHNFLQGDGVRAVNASGALPDPLLEGVVYFVRYITNKQISLHNSLADASSGANPITLLSSGSGVTSIIKTIPASASLGTNNNITAPAHNLNLAGGDLVQFQSSGSLPTPVSQNTAYRADPPSTVDTFSLNTTAPAAVNITATGSGQLLLVISRAMSVGFSGQWETDATLINNGDPVKIESDGALPSTNPTTDNTTTYYARKINDNTIELFLTAAQAIETTIYLISNRARATNVATLTTANPHNRSTGDYVDIRGMTDTTYNVERTQITVTGANTFTYSNTGSNEGSIAEITGQMRVANIKVTGPGAGNIRLDFERSVTVVPFTSLLRLDSTEFFQSGATVRLETDGTLPAPLGINTDYKAVLSGSLVQITDLIGTPITLLNIGSGNHLMVIERNFTVTLPDGFLVNENVYNNGDAIVVRSTGTPPTPLVSGATYYVRRTDNNNIELYDTSAHAINTASTTGIIMPTDKGTGVHTLERFLPAYKFQKITRVAKDATQGFVELYAWDEGRAENLTKLGRYYPDETEPRYRRIRIGSPCQWIRMRFKRKAMPIVSKDDYIPLRSGVALKTMVKSVQLLRNNFFDESQKYETLAVQYLTENETKEDGPETVSIQVNADVLTNPSDYLI